VTEAEPVATPTEQLVARDHIGSHARLLAGPGTGKTWVLTHRVAALVRDQHVAPNEILALTFTRYAAGELRRRVRDQLGELANPQIRTIHSFALQQLVANKVDLHGRGRVRVADDWEERHVVVEDIKRMLGLPEVDAAKDLLKQLGAGWQRLDVDAVDWETSFPNPAFLGALAEHQDRYQYVLRDELVYLLRQQLRLHPDSFHVTGPIRHLLIDEYQDLNRCELDVIRRMADSGAEVFVAGDDDQSIYGFRYAHPEGIRRFIADYDAAPLVLTTCHRCGQAVLDVAHFVIRQDFRRLEKELQAAEGKPPGRAVILHFPNGMSEAAGIAMICQYLLADDRLADKRLEPHDILILLRSDHHGAYSALLADALSAIGIPTAITTSADSILDTTAGRQVVSALQLILDSEDSLAWRTWIQTTPGIGRERLEAVDRLCHELRSPLGEVRLRLPTAGLLAAVNSAVHRAQSILDATSVEEAVDVPTTQAMVRDLTSRVLSVPEADDVQEELAGLIDLHQAIGLDGILSTIQDRAEELQQDLARASVNIITMHKAKGLTARCTIVAAADDQLIPGSRDVEEERRLLYVSLTRAVDRLVITYAEERHDAQLYTGRDSGKPRRDLTRFLQEAPAEFLDGPDFVKSLAS
jgi:DNA helicase-2/ATP-dependent DNA helicase PcrA